MADAFVTRPLYELLMQRLREHGPELVAVVEAAMRPEFVIRVLRGPQASNFYERVEASAGVLVA